VTPGLAAALAADCGDWLRAAGGVVLAVFSPGLLPGSKRALALLPAEDGRAEVFLMAAGDKLGPLHYLWSTAYLDPDAAVEIAGGAHCARVWVGDGERLFNEWLNALKLERM
jgi:hypothetical protein